MLFYGLVRQKNARDNDGTAFFWGGVLFFATFIVLLRNESNKKLKSLYFFTDEIDSTRNYFSGKKS